MNLPRHVRWILMALLGTGSFLTSGMAADQMSGKRPNVVLILADDLGFSDLGCYGGEIPTPQLDALASEGLRYTQFYNTARCWPSRASALSGFYAQQVRRDTVPGVQSGNNGKRPSWARLLPEYLRDLGYRSYHSGKWHVDGKPLAHGFDRSYRLDDHDRYFAPRLHSEDEVALEPVPAQSNYYATTAIADHAIRCLKDHASRFGQQPFFSLVAFTAPHFPLQAPASDVDRHRNRYLTGWDQLREERWNRIRSSDLISGTLPPMEREIGPPYDFPDALKALGGNEVNRPRAWTELSPSQQRFQADKMSVHAAMVDRMDREIGRIVALLRAQGHFEDTLLIFLSDNGASAEMMVRGDGHAADALCGTGASFLSIGPGWSSLANTPFRRHKTWVHEGGISTPLIVHWPLGITERGALRTTPGHVIDLVPTILELAGGNWPPKNSPLEMPKPPGHSLVRTFTRDTDLQRESIWWQHEGNRALREGDWKIVAAGAKSAWELYNLAEDRCETANLASQYPDRVQAMAARWVNMTASHAATARNTAGHPFPEWKHSGSMFVLTTPDGAHLPERITLESFPLLVRLDGDGFNFSQACPHGEDLRFSTPEGRPLPFEIESWDASNGSAAIWVLIPQIRGNHRQELRLHWGNPTAQTPSRGTEVFNRSNGYIGTWHLGDSVQDVTGSVSSENRGTTLTQGIIGTARNFKGGQGIFGGNTQNRYPTGAAPHTSQAWFRADQANGRILAWGNEQAQGKVVLHYASPPQIRLDCYFSGADVATQNPVPAHQWTQVVHTWEAGESRVYINGVLDGVSRTPRAPLNLRQPAQLWIGGWYEHFDFKGVIDEVRVSNRVRSPEWIHFEYENQKMLQTAVGSIVRTGRDFGVTAEQHQGQAQGQAVVNEGQALGLVATAGGAQRVWWSRRVGEGQAASVVAVNQFRYSLPAGRVSGDQSVTVTFHAAYPEGVRQQEIRVTVREAIPDPEFSLKAPSRWDGRSPLTLKAQPKSTEAALIAAGASPLKVTWSVEPLATIRETRGNDLILKRALQGGRLTVTATLDNGGTPIRRSVTLSVQPPDHDAWVPRVPESTELPEDNQFYARNDRNEGTLMATGSFQEPTEAVVVRLLAQNASGTGDRLVMHRRERLGVDRTFRIELPLKPGLIAYRFELARIHAGREIRIHTATNLVCGDAYLIDGQSNAVATDWGPDKPDFQSNWIRSFGSMGHEPAESGSWGTAVHRGRDNERHQVGYWAMELGRHLVETHQIPVCFLNGAVGGSRIDQHQRNPTRPTDPSTIYGRLLARAHAARLTHGLRAVIWHQGENDQGADGPSGGYGWETYRTLFIDLAAAWATDYPNLRHHYAFQIWPKACSMGSDGSDNRLREVQRNLPSALAHLSVMSSAGIQPPGECHYPAQGYAEMARLIAPLIDRDLHGVRAGRSVTAPNLVRAGYRDSARLQLLLEFDQPIGWDPALVSEFWLDGIQGRVASGITEGHRLILTLREPSQARTLTYLNSASWNPKRLLRGINGIAALTFCEVPLTPAKAAPTRQGDH